MVGSMDVYDHLFEFAHHPFSLFNIIFYLFGGFVACSVSWNTMEATYENALIEARVNAAPGGVLRDNPFTESRLIRGS